MQKLKTKVYSRIENNGTTQLQNNGVLKLTYDNEDWGFSKKIDINRNFSMRVQKLLKQDFVKGHTIFCKFDKESASQSDSLYNPCFGFYKNFDNYAYKGKFNFETLVAQLKGKAVFDKHSSDKEQYGTGVSANIDLKKNIFSNFKSLVYYDSSLTSMSMQQQLKQIKSNIINMCNILSFTTYNYLQLFPKTLLYYFGQIKKISLRDGYLNLFQFSQMKRQEDHEQNQGGEIYYTFLYSLFQKINDDLNISVELSHDSNEKKFGMVFGGKYTKFDKVVCRAKIDDKFTVNSSFEIDISKNIKFTVSNMLDLSLRNKKDATSSAQSFPIGFKLDICQ